MKEETVKQSTYEVSFSHMNVSLFFHVFKFFQKCATNDSVPCGDANWIFDSFVTDALPFFLGLDITGSVIRLNEKRFAHHKNKQFHFWDATTCTLPRYLDESSDVEQSFDLVHVRDVI